MSCFKGVTTRLQYAWVACWCTPPFADLWLMAVVCFGKQSGEPLCSTTLSPGHLKWFLLWERESLAHHIITALISPLLSLQCRRGLVLLRHYIIHVCLSGLDTRIAYLVKNHLRVCYQCQLHSDAFQHWLQESISSVHLRQWLYGHFVWWKNSAVVSFC